MNKLTPEIDKALKLLEFSIDLSERDANGRWGSLGKCVFHNLRLRCNILRGALMQSEDSSRRRDGVRLMALRVMLHVEDLRSLVPQHHQEVAHGIVHTVKELLISIGADPVPGGAQSPKEQALRIETAGDWPVLLADHETKGQPHAG